MRDVYHEPVRSPTHRRHDAGARLLVRAVACLAACLMAACAGDDLLEDGRWEGTVFVHDGLGLRVTVPEIWVIAPDEAISQLSSTGRDVLSRGDPTGTAYGAEGPPTSRTLFAVYRFPLGTVQGINPSLVAAVENVSARPQTQTAADYLQMLQSFLSRGGTPMVFEPIATESLLAGQEFAVLGVTIQPEPGARIAQVYHARRVEDYVFTVVATFSTPEQWLELEAILRTMVMER
jgi:hypothetical protein